jgi:hypothetical protein
MKFTNLKICVKLPGVSVENTWEIDEQEVNAAWELYIELITRIAIEELEPNEGLMREALSSLYSLFTITRDILKKYGPSIARPKGKNDNPITLGYLAIAILNTVLRPFLAKWHPLLAHHEHKKPVDVSSIVHERSWERNADMRRELKSLQSTLFEYANILAQACNVPLLIFKR